MIVGLSKRLLLEPRELRNALWLGAVYLAITCSYTLVKTARDSLFLSLLPAWWLPYVYVMVGVVMLAVSLIFGRLTQRLSPLLSLAGTALVSAVGLVAFALGFDTRRLWIPMGFYLWVNAYGLILTSQFWVFTNSVSNPREAKRIFGIVGGGGILGGLLGGTAAAWLGPRISLAWLAVIGAALVALVIPTLTVAVRRGRVHRGEEVTTASTEPSPALRSVSYVRWLAIATLCSVVVTGLLDYQLKVVIQQAYPTAPQLARFFGKFYIGINIIALLFQLLGTRWLLQRLGAGSAAGVLPMGLAAGATGMLISPGLASSLVSRMWDQILRFSLYKSATELFYFPLDAGLRRRAKAFIEAGIERVGDAIAGLVILGVGVTLGTTPRTIPGLVLAIVLIWLIVWWKLRAGYVRELARNLHRMKLDPEHDAVSLRERSILKEMVRMLDSPYERLVIHAIEILEEEGAERLVHSRLAKLLDHRSPRVRARALGMATAQQTEEARAQVARLVHDPDPMVRLMALRAHCALGEGQSLAALDEFLGSEEAEVRATALAALAEYAPPSDLSRVRALLEDRLHGEVEDRVAAAEAIGARPAPSEIHDLLVPLLDDVELPVRCAALRAVGSSGFREHAPALIRALSSRDTELAAHDGLLSFGELIVGTLGDWLSDPRVPIEIRRVIPRVIADIATPESVSALFRARDRADVALSYRILKASNRLRDLDPTLVFPADRVQEDLDHDVRSFLIAEFHEAQTGGETEDESFLRLVLRERIDQSFNRVFRRLALLYPPRVILPAYRGTLARDARVRGNAAEYLETALSADHRALVMPLLPDSTPDLRRELAKTRYGLEAMSPVASLALLLESEDPWLRACALYVAGRRREHGLRDKVEASLEAADARVRETADWARLALDAG